MESGRSEFVDTRSRELGGRAEGGEGGDRPVSALSHGPSGLRGLRGSGWLFHSDFSALSGPPLVSSLKRPIKLVGWARHSVGLSRSASVLALITPL